jgi:hypothetical protein
VDFLVHLSLFPVFLGHDLPLPCLFNQLVLDLFLPEGSLPLELLVVVVNAFVLAINLSVGRLELVGLNPFVCLLDFVIEHFIVLSLLVFLLKLQVESIHHFLSEVAGLLDVVFL